MSDGSARPRPITHPRVPYFLGDDLFEQLVKRANMAGAVETGPSESITQWLIDERPLNVKFRKNEDTEDTVFVILVSVHSMTPAEFQASFPPDDDDDEGPAISVPGDTEPRE